jgi:peptide/nickel transport system ATP-binding protein
MSTEDLPGPDDDVLLSADRVTVHFPVHQGRHRGRVVRALEGASLQLRRGAIVALVGESGSGKTTLARALANVQRPTDGEIRLSGQPVRARGRRARREYSRRVQMVLQDPFSSLNPLHRVRYLLSRPLRLHGTVTDSADLDRQLARLLERVQLTPPERYLDAYPHELSGGQRQRVAIARALAVRPDVLLGDEPVSMLDVSMRLEVLNLLSRLRDEDSLAMLYITHDIASARYFTDEIAVMYAGQMVEFGPSDEVVTSPQHPYTQLLLDSSPDPDRMRFLGDRGDDPDDPEAAVEQAEPPDLIDPPEGCRFQPRCPFALARCAVETPPAFSTSDHQWARCWLRAAPDIAAGPAEAAETAETAETRGPDR